MLKLIAIPGAALTIISALTGYIVGQHEDAAVIERALPIITEAARQTGLANGQANSAAAEATSILKDAKSKSIEITEVQQKITGLLNSNNDAIKKNFSDFANSLVRNKEFTDALGTAYQSDVSTIKSEFSRLADRFVFSIVRTDFITQQASLSCPTGAKLVSAACIGNNGSLQAAVGPEFRSDGSVGCYRYGSSVMPVQATAICLQIK